MYPQSDSTSSDMQKVLFKPGIVSFNEDFQSVENNREIEEINRFNSIVKVNGIVSDKKSKEITYLFPAFVTGQQISISKGTGFTRNGARITIPSDISVTDITTLVNYTVPSSTKNVYLVLRKYVEEYQSRNHPITGATTKTRQRIKTDNTIVEFVVDDLLLRDDSKLITDKDIVVLGKLTAISPITFDVTESVGGRKILRTTEARALEVTGGIMEGDINMVDKYNLLNTPQWGKGSYNINGSTHNKDFVRLFSRLNYSLSLLRGLKFISNEGVYGLKFEDSDSVKISLIPNQKPPQKIDIKNKNNFLTIPTNNVLYLQLTDTNVLLTSGSNTNILEINNDNRYFVVSDFLNGINLGSIIGNSLLRFPICYHHIDTITNERKLVFANGLSLLLNEEIDSAGKYSGYVRRDGGNIMTGDLRIEKVGASVVFKKNSTPSTTNVSAGLKWRSSNEEIVLGNFVRLENLTPTDSDDDVVGDFHFDVFNDAGDIGKKFKFKLDGRLVVPTAPNNLFDVVRLQELNTKVNLSGADQFLDTNLIFVNGKTITIKNNTPEIVLEDTTSAETYQSFTIKNNNGFAIGRLVRYSSDVNSLGYADGDLVIETYSNAENSPMRVVLRRTLNSFEIPNILLTEGNIYGPTYFDKSINIKDNSDSTTFVSGFSKIGIVNDSLGVRGHLKTLSETVQLVNKSATVKLYPGQNMTEAYINGSGGAGRTFLTLNVPQDLVNTDSVLMINATINFDWGGATDKTVVGRLLNPNGDVLQYFYGDSPASNIQSITVNFSKIVTYDLFNTALHGDYLLQIISCTAGGSPTLAIKGSNDANETHMSYVVLS